MEKHPEASVLSILPGGGGGGGGGGTHYILGNG